MINRNIIGKQVKLIRQQRGLTQEQLLAKLQVQGIKIDRPMISKIENHSREVLDFEVKALSEALGVQVNDLFNKLSDVK